MSDQLILDDDALGDAASHFTIAADEMTRRMRAPLGEVTGLTNLEHRFNEFLCGISAARRVLGEAAHAGGVAVVAWMADSNELDAGLGSAVGRATAMTGRN